MAKSHERNRAQALRSKGQSIGEIAHELKVSKGSVSLWCRDIQLSPRQIEALDRKMLYGSYRGRIIAAQLKKQEKAVRVLRMQNEGRGLLSAITSRDFFVFGLGLYWGEGTKNGRVKFTNSNPILIKLFIRWVQEIWKIPTTELTFLILINLKHKHRLPEVLKYWSGILHVAESQFIKPTLVKSKVRKDYTDFPKYYGTIQVHVKKSTNLLYKIHGALKKIGETMAR